MNGEKKLLFSNIVGFPIVNKARQGVVCHSVGANVILKFGNSPLLRSRSELVIA